MVTPESTRRVLQPPFCPNKISVSNLSPTMHICDFEMPNLFNEITTVKGNSREKSYLQFTIHCPK